MEYSALLDFVFFFFKQKTAYELLSGDWSSDVCSSDLGSPSISVAVSMASQTPPINPSPIADCGLRIAESMDERQIRNPQSAIRNHPPSGIPSPYLLENADVGFVTVTQVEVPI